VAAALGSVQGDRLPDIFDILVCQFARAISEKDWPHRHPHGMGDAYYIPISDASFF
jgi:hypothetical protein